MAEVAGNLENNRRIQPKVKTSRMNINFAINKHVHAIKGLIKDLTPIAAMATVACGGGGCQKTTQSSTNIN